MPELPRPGEGLTSDGQRLVLRMRERAAVKDRLFRLSAADADSFAQDLITGRSVLRPVGLRAVLEGRIGGPARLRLAVAERGSSKASMQVTVESEAPLQRAQTAALSEAKARAALGALGGTPYTLDALDYRVEHDAFLPVAGLKQLRRRAVAELDGRRSAAWRRVSRHGGRPPARRRVASAPAQPREAAEVPGRAAPASG